MEKRGYVFTETADIIFENLSYREMTGVNGFTMKVLWRAKG